MLVCCAREDAEPLSETLSVLREDGLEVELVEGLDEDAKRLTAVIEKHGGAGLYVLCRSPRLGREQVEELRELLLARHVPFARTLTVAVGGRGALADRIRSGLRRSSTRGGGSSRSAASSRGASARASSGRVSITPTDTTEDEEPTLVGRRDALGTTPPSPPRPPAKPRPPSGTSAVNKRPPAPPRPPASASKPPAPSKPPPPPAPDAADSMVATATESMIEEIETSPEDTSLSNPRISMSDLDLSDLDDSITDMRMPAEESTSEGQLTAQISGDTVIGPMPAMITGDTLTGEKIPEDFRKKMAALGGVWPEPRPATTEPAPALPAPESTPTAADSGEAFAPSLPEFSDSAAHETNPAAEDVTRPGSSEDSNAAPALPPPDEAEDVATVPVPALTTPRPVVATNSSPLESTVPTPVVQASNEPGPAPVGPSFASSSGSLPSWLPWALGGAAVLLLCVVVAVAAWPDDEPDEVASNEATSEPKDDDAPKPEADPTPEKKAEAAPPVKPPPPKTYPVLAALRTRQVRALDVLLVATETSNADDHAAASQYCEALEIAGLGGWRLPDVGELRSLSDAQMIQSNKYYWSATAADLFGDTHLAWYGRRKYAKPHAKAALTQCVRGSSSDS